MHIHDVGQGAQHVNGLQSALPFDPVFPTDKKQDRRADENNRADAGVEPLHGVDEVIEIEFVDVEEQGDYEDQDRQAQDHGGGAQGQVGLLDPMRLRHAFLGDALQLGHDLAEAGAGETLSNAGVQGLDGLDDLLRIEPAIVGGGFFHRLS